VIDRWRLVYSRLNELTAPEEDEGVWEERQVAVRWLDALMHAPVPRRLHIRASDEEREVGPPCPECRAPVDRSEDLAACTACLDVYHHACLPDRRGCRCGV
jgi:hypothetical protein